MVVGEGLRQAVQTTIGPVFLLYLSLALLAGFAIPLLGYRAISLQRSSYLLEREGLRLRWGLRVEEIPMDAILWMRRASDLEFKVPLPWLRWPGALMGTRRLPGDGQVEFLAANTNNLILVATIERSYAISPENPGEFLRTFHHFAELGSLDPIPARSIYPSFLLARVWADRLARYLLLGGLVLTFVLLVWVSLLVPGRESVPLGFRPDGSPGNLVPAVQLLLLPVASTLFYITNLSLGLFLYRQDGIEELGIPKIMAYLLWGSGVLTPLFFLGAVYFIQRAG